jgi:hypothetical protein
MVRSILRENRPECEYVSSAACVYPILTFSLPSFLESQLKTVSCDASSVSADSQMYGLRKEKTSTTVLLRELALKQAAWSNIAVAFHSVSSFLTIPTSSSLI